MTMRLQHPSAHSVQRHVEHETVGAEAAGKHVATACAVQRIVARAAVENVLEGGSDKIFSRRCTDKVHRSLARIEDLGAHCRLRLVGSVVAEVGPRNDEAPVGPEGAASAAALYFNNRKLSIFGGSNEIQKNIISKMILGL